MENTNEIRCEITDIEKLKNIFEKQNNDIIEKLEKIKKEYSAISNVISTPNSNKIMPQLTMIIDNEEKMVEKKGIYFKKVFETVIKEYKTFLEETDKTVSGDKNGKNL